MFSRAGTNHGAGRRAAGGLLLLSCLAGAPAGAVQQIALDLGELAGAGWRARGASASLDVGGPQPVLRLAVPAVVADDGTVLARDIRAECREPVVNAEYVACASGSADGVVPPSQEPVSTTLAFALRRSDGHWRAHGMLEVGEAVAWTARADGDGLTATASGDALPLEALRPWLPRLPGDITSIAGRIGAFDVSLVMPPGEEARASLQAQGRDLGFDTENGLVAAAGVAADVSLDWRATADGWRGRVEAGLSAGELLAGSFYTSLGGAPVLLSGSVTAEGERWRIEQLTVEDADALALRGSGLWHWSAEPALRELAVTVERLAFPGFYSDYLQPVLAQYGFGELALSGNLSGGLRMQDGGLASLALSLDHLDVSDSQGRLEFTDLSGDLRWQDQGEALPSNLTWQGARIYSIGLGGADIRAEAVADDLRLTRATELPVLDGKLVINALEATDWFGEAPELLFDARLMPVSLGALSQALEWPELQGSLAGRIPELTLRDGVYRLGGSLVMDVFDGTVFVENLRVERPFGVLPKLVADIRLEDLDLEKLTGIFTIGRITGRLGGYIRNLRLLDWQAVHFDARLATPEDDDSRHRISQRAVDTLTNLGGGGASGALSRTFLRIFDDFAYQQIGITCRLENNVCRMDGVAPAPNNGYYIVEGGGLPRVDVIGHVRRVDWPVLMDQLMQAMQGKGPTVGGNSGGS